jgi:hypothetical protein
LPSGLQPSRLLAPLVVAERVVKEPRIDLGWPGLDPVRPSLDLINFDDSGSVVSVGGSDPIGNRFTEAARAVEVVHEWCITKRAKVAVLHFDYPLKPGSRVMPLSASRTLVALRGELRTPTNGVGTSDLTPSLSQAEVLAATHPDHDVRLTILSDFELTDADPSDVFARLLAFPGEVHAVVLNAEPPTDLRGENITITRLRHGDTPGALAAAIHRSLTATRRGRRLSILHADRTQPSIPPLSPEGIKPQVLSR